MYNFIKENYKKGVHELATLKKTYYYKVLLPDGTYEWEESLDRPTQDQLDNGDAKTKINNEYQKLRPRSLAKQHEVPVHTPDGDVIMIFKGKSLTAGHVLNNQNNMFRAWWSEKILDGSKPGWVFDNIGYLNNMYKAVMTSWNFVFPITNFTRDAQESAYTQFIKGDSGTKVIKNYKKAMPAMKRYLMGKSDMNNPIDQQLVRFYELGGATGYTHSKSVDEVEKELRREMKRALRSGLGKIGNWPPNAVEVISAWNQLFEDATRFSVYLSSLELGKSEKDAAYDAKEASLNFNRKGKSSKAFDSIWAFFNVALEGANKNLGLAKHYPKRFAYVASAWITLGFVEALLNSLSDDDDDDNDYRNISAYMRENYLILPNIPRIILGKDKGDKYLSIPLPQFWRAFKSMGNLAYESTFGDMKVGEAIGRGTLNFVSSLTPIDIGGFVQDGKFRFSPIVPTILKPIQEVIANENFIGNPIYNVPFTKTQEKYLLDSGLGKKNVSVAVKFVTDGLIRVSGTDSGKKYYTDPKTGLDKKIKEVYDWNPSKIEHIIKGYTAGTGSAFVDLFTTAYQLASPAELDFTNVPFLNKFLRSTPEAKWETIGKYYDLREELEVHGEVESGYRTVGMENVKSEKEEPFKKFIGAKTNKYYIEIGIEMEKAEAFIDKEYQLYNIYENKEAGDRVTSYMNEAVKKADEIKKKYNIKD
jgi:hypothetical protein